MLIIYLRDRNQTALDNLRDYSPSPPAIQGQSDPEMALSFLQQLDGKLAALGMSIHLGVNTFRCPLQYFTLYL